MKSLIEMGAARRSPMKISLMLCGVMVLAVIVWLAGCGGDDGGGPSGPGPTTQLVMKLEWAGAGDLDLSATTPNGTVSAKTAAPDPNCTHSGDNAGTGTGPYSETITCSDPATGDYDIAVNNQSANPIDYTLSVTVDDEPRSGFPVSQSVAGGAQADHSLTHSPPVVTIPCGYCFDRPDGVAVRIHILNANSTPGIRVVVDNPADSSLPCTMYYCGGAQSCFSDDSGQSACYDGDVLYVPCNDRCTPKIYELDYRQGEFGQAVVTGGPGSTISFEFSYGDVVYTTTCVLADDIHTNFGGQAFATFYASPPSLVCDLGFAGGAN